MEQKLADENEFNPESLMEYIKEKDTKNYYLINKENLIFNIFSYLQDKNQETSNKMIIVKYLIKSLSNINFTTELLIANKKNGKCLYHIIIYEYILNYEQKEYCEELKNLFCILIQNTSYNKEIYKYIISYISNYINRKSLLLNKNNIDENAFEEEIKDFNSNHLLSILELIRGFYENGKITEEPFNYFYFSGYQNNNITIKNNKSLLDLNKDIYILLYINLFNLDYIEKFDKMSLMEIEFSNDKKVNINIISDNENNGGEDENSIALSYSSFSTQFTNKMLVKINKNSKIEILINNTPQKISEISNNEKKIESLILFNNFIGACSNIIIYKSNSMEMFIPKFLNSDLYKNGIYSEELFSNFIKSEIMNEIDESNILDKKLTNFKSSELAEIKIFLEKNLISIYIPTRVEQSSENKNYILKDSINNLDAIFNLNNSLSGIHSFKNVIRAFYSIGSINHLLPIIELLNKETSLASIKIIDIFTSIITYIFSNLSKLFQLYDKNSQFFYYLSYFLERIPENLYGEELCQNLKSISIVFLAFKDDTNYQLLSQQFLEYVLLNEKILFKFPFEQQKDIIKQIIDLINVSSKSELSIEINIITIINILLYYDSKKYNKYCCKKHADYFKDGEEKGIISPELNDLIGPVIDLIKEIIDRYLIQFKKSIQQIKDYNLSTLFDLLAFDISPCLQKAVLNLFYNLKGKMKELSNLNKNGKFLFILLFILKTSLFDDIKSLAYDFIMILFNDSNSQNMNSNIRQYIEKYILPNYLLIDNRGKSIKVANVSGEIDEGKFEEFFFINNIKYNYLTLSPEQEKLNINYNKIKLDELINNFFDKIYNNFNSGTDSKMNLNLLVKIVSKGDILLYIKFLDKIKQELESKGHRFLEKQTEIISSNNLLHWLLETSFHSYLLLDSIEDLNNYGFKIPSNINNEEKILYIQQILEKTNKLLIYIFNSNIYKLDYLITWSKYYYEIIEEENNFRKIREFVYDLIFKKLINELKEIYQPNISVNKSQKCTLYFYNIIFEYYSYYKIKANLNNQDIKDEEILYQEISTPFKHKILSELKKEVKDNFSEDSFNLISKLPFYPFMKQLYSLFKPMWYDDKKRIINDKDFYNTYIYHKQNIYINDLELLFYSFNDINELHQTDPSINIYGNKGVPLIYIIFHQFTIFLTLITDKNEFKELVINFRKFISLIIISSCTLSISKGKGNTSSNTTKIIGETNKINWPNEDQYKTIQQKVKLFLFNCFHFFYYKIIEINQNIKKYENDQEKLDTYSNNKKCIYDTICYFLRILNVILKEIKIHEEKKKKNNIKAMFSKIKKMIVTKTEGIALSGPYLFIYELYTNCFVGNKQYNENFDMINFIINNKTFMDDIPVYNIDDIFKDTSSNYKKIYPKIEKAGNEFINDANIKKYLDDNLYEYQKVLFPFLNYIIKRKELSHNIIPIYDNSLYCKYNYSSLCLLPNYFPDYPYEKNITNNVQKINENLSNEIRYSQMKLFFDNYDRITKYYKLKKRLFTFNGLWSKYQFFYDKNKYRLKYKIFNHLTEDFTKIFLTPIIDIEYYLPKFSSFNTKELFREDTDNIVSLKTVTDLSSDSIEKTVNKEEGAKEEEKKDNEKEVVKADKKNEDSEFIEEQKEEQFNKLYLLKKINYKFAEDLNQAEKNSKKHYILFRAYVMKKNKININDYCSEEVCCLVKPSYHIKGVFYNNSNEIGFYGFDKIPYFSQEEYDQERQSCFGSVFKTQKRKYDGYHLTIPYRNIAFILKRRYFFKTVALEVFTLTNKSYYFKFNDKNIKKIYDNIRHLMKSTVEDIYIEYSKIDSKIGFVNNNDNNNFFTNTSMLMYKRKDMNLKNLYEKWSTWEMSTLKFLMLSNIYANRSLNDVNQYPVFPWVITNYTASDYNSLLTDKNLIRPFGVPMGMMDITEGAENRKNNFLEHWASMEEDEEKTPNYDRYGTHYSTSLYVSYYLIRIFPFSNIRIEIQGSKFDDPNRLFLTMQSSFNNAITQKTDLRELIPELFCFPEMFYNINNLNLGELSENLDTETPQENNSDNIKRMIVNDVEMPKWSNNDGYIFIQKHRELLESQEVSEKINEWFNIIFGSKQKGPAAKKINNLFLDQTYDDFEEQYDKSSMEDKINQFRMVEFGVTPNQIFKADTSKRKLYHELKNKKQMLFNITEDIKKGEIVKNYLDFEEIDCDFDKEEPYRIYDFQKEGYKKWRIYILTKDKIKIFTKKIEKIEIEEESNNNVNNNDKMIHKIMHNLKETTGIENKTLSKINILIKDDVKLPEYKYKLNNISNYYNCSIIYGKGAYIALGGYWNGNIIVKSLDYKVKQKDSNKTTYIYSTNETSPITKITIDESETFAICGNKLGNVFIFVINPEKKYSWSLSKILSYHKSEITSLAISENLNMFISCSKDGNCMLYSLPRIKLFNSWNISLDAEDQKANDIICSIIIIFHSPLPCFIFYIKNINSFYIYSINGKFLKKHKLEYEIVNNAIAKYIDYQLKDYLLIYNSKDKTIDVHRGIDFDLITKSPVINYKFIDFVLCKALDHAMILVENENFNEKETEIDGKKIDSKYKILVLKDKENELKWK